MKVLSNIALTVYNLWWFDMTFTPIQADAGFFNERNGLSRGDVAIRLARKNEKGHHVRFHC
jgi:hypothetical protein